jgi:hypothetical protein
MEKQIEPDKLLAALQAEKARRLQAAVEAGEAVVLQPLAVIGIRAAVREPDRGRKDGGARALSS